MSEDTSFLVAIMGSSHIGELMQSAELDPFLDRLATYVKVDRKALRRLVFEAGAVYERAQAETYLATSGTMHELPAAAGRLAQILTDDDNLPDAVALFRTADDTLEDLQRAKRQHQAFVRKLETLARNAPPPPPPQQRRSGNPGTSADFKEMVLYLAREWEKLTGQPPTNDWHAGKPLSPAARFIGAIVEFIAPEWIGKVDKVLEKFIADRRKIPDRPD